MKEHVVRAAIGLAAMWVLLTAASKILASGAPDGGWYYHSAANSTQYGQVNVYSDYPDSRGIPWSEK
jgi:hypothetical protein